MQGYGMEALFTMLLHMGIQPWSGQGSLFNCLRESSSTQLVGQHAAGTVPKRHYDSYYVTEAPPSAT
jgi:hypothetical protein